MTLPHSTDASRHDVRRLNIAITGGIGSGKSYVCRLLGQHGISVYDCDAAAKRLMATDAQLQEGLRRLVGPEVYSGTTLQKQVLAKYLLASEANKQRVNSVVHPAVAADFLHSSFEWLESAILFESGFYKRIPFDFVVCVAAPTDVRLSRIIRRDSIPADKAREWIDSQMPQEEVTRRSDFVIINDGQQPLEPQIDRLLTAVDEARNARPAR